MFSVECAWKSPCSRRQLLLLAECRTEKKLIVVVCTPQFEASLRKELEVAQAGREAFVAEFSESDYEAIVSGWQEKLARVAQGEQRWGLFVARKPA